MPNWTKDQEKAIQYSNSNILVSAGAGSGKTAVLTERVISKLRQGIHIDQLLILTFTKLAANEMRERIRLSIEKMCEKVDLSLEEKEHFQEQLEKVDAAYICTFDSYALSVVKKYHYLLGMEKTVEIADENRITVELFSILDEIFTQKYSLKQDLSFLQCIETFFLKDDQEFKNILFSMHQQLEMKINRKEFIENYFSKFTSSFYQEKRKEYMNLLQSRINQLKDMALEVLDEIDDAQYQDFNDVFQWMFSFQLKDEETSYQELQNHLENFSLPKLSKNQTEECKEKKKRLSDEIKKLKVDIQIPWNRYVTSVLETSSMVQSMLDILNELDERLRVFKKQNNLYTFNDIAKSAITLVEHFPSVQKEIKQQFIEIMIDEYQDTSDIQETFIHFIANNNVYMVGDIKQSIYRFRHANPTLFKEKYEQYTNQNEGIKIDLKENFRSRKEVVDDINFIFSDLMSLSMGGADYRCSHQMAFGNRDYEKNTLPTQNQHMELYTYLNFENTSFSKEEIEAFMIAEDIQNKIQNHFQVMDKKQGILRDACYSDFVILMDRGTSFPLYKKIFEYLSIPLSIYEDERLENATEIDLLYHIMQLIGKVKRQEFDQTFSYLFIFIARSFLYETSDQELFEYITKRSFHHHPLMAAAKNVLKHESIDSLQEFQNDILKQFGFYEHWMKIGHIEETIVRLTYLDQYAKTFGSIGYTIDEYIDFLKEILENQYTIRYQMQKETTGSCKIMNIHKSKGLEFPICYFSGIYKTFNQEDQKKKFFLSEDYGIIVPNDSLENQHTFLRELYLEQMKKEDLSEKLRLFYVALTRCREKIIILFPQVDETKRTDKIQSFQDFLIQIYEKLKPYEKKIETSKVSMTHSYQMTKVSKWHHEMNVQKEKIEVHPPFFFSQEEEKKHFSKTLKQPISSSMYEKMKYGTKIHTLLQQLDLKHPDISSLSISKQEQEWLYQFLSSSLLSSIQEAQVFQEYHFLYAEEGILHEGIIDLMLIYNDHIDIIDYKLKEIEDEAYLEQLKGYYHYIALKTTKKIHLYLYSILEGIEKEIPIV